MGVNHAAPNLYEFSDERPRERELAIKHTLKTFEFAERVGAPLVVLHIGSMRPEGLHRQAAATCSNAAEKRAQIREALRRILPTREAKKERFSKTSMTRCARSCLKPSVAVINSAAKTGKRSRNSPSKAISNSFPRTEQPEPLLLA